MRLLRMVMLTGGLGALSFCAVAEAQTVVRQITFPVNGEFSFRNDFAEPRAGGAREHLGIDIIATKMTPLVAAVDGRITYMPTTEPSWGYSITIRDADGYSYRYLHVNNDTPGTDDGQGGAANAYAPGLARGSSVTRGQHIGWVGDSGNAENVGAHLHFEIRLPDRTPTNPYDSLIAASGGKTGASTPTIEHAPEVGVEVEESVRSLAEGASGTDVTLLQDTLRQLGYFKQESTGYFGPITHDAVIAFQKANGIEPIGVVGPKTRAALDAAVTRYVFTTYLEIGMQGEAVRHLQLSLAANGYFKSEVTGYFGPLTRAAVVAFQSEHGIEPLGIVGPLTRAALNGLP